uniref:Uncharacterized protein YuzE n=1 Tax=Candidatus Kentrum sp. DK TaxID=2126562 RepID=A0A450SZB6_9GAMM|nr:MAG: Uncharacterized protein YuzE [Candidatus Kentron sp. DK]VFJ64367.1 MAG: Uncharacterized protein YuzE [Candidatus Kentron sp. DK]
MKIIYFEDTDTALMEFSDHPIRETREVNENLTIDMDNSGNVVGITVEHASMQANMREMSFERMADQGLAGAGPFG